MTTIFIDNKNYAVSEKQNLLEAAISLGLDLPYFCWHPALGSVGSCRQCAVQQFSSEEDKQGRLVMACMTPLKEGARFSIDHPTCSNFRKSVIEWLMINHPHDCPVCDEGGECHLQDMTLMTGHNYRRHRFSKRTFTNQNLGPFINHEMNRCITCYRCVRYYQGIAGGDDLSAFASSQRVYFGRFEEGALLSPFSGNLAEICPTGVFTDKVYHQHYTRKWDLETAPSICQLCSLGCNIAPGARTSILRRVQNRYHHDINGFFLCDRGRFGHEFVNAAERIKLPLLKQDNKFKILSIEEGKQQLSDMISTGPTIGFGSPRASLEANWALKQLVGENNFYAGVNYKESAFAQEVCSLFEAKKTTIASLRDIRESDCVLILGEDVTNTAPMIALSIRQASYGFKQSCAESIDVPYWNDAAIKNFTADQTFHLFIASAYQTELDTIAHESHLVGPDHMAQYASQLLKAINNESLGETHDNSFITRAAQALRAAKNPVVITGTSMSNIELLHAAQNIVQALTRNLSSKPKLSVVLSDVNCLGLFMLKPQLIDEEMDFITKGTIKNAIVIENDLFWRLGEKHFSSIEKSTKNIIVLDSLQTDTAKRASLVLPCASFAESNGSVISSEGRLQQYFSVFKNQNGIESSFHILSPLLKKYSLHALDQAHPFLASDLGISPDTFKNLFDADFKIMGKGIARQTEQASGRTALLANISIHEQPPAKDADSPLIYSMEGARKKIPLPLISTYREPGWNSVQAELKKDIGVFHPSLQKQGGICLFKKDESKPVTFHVIKNQATDLRKEIFPHVFVMPAFNIFASMENARFTGALASRIPLIEAQISLQDAKTHNLPMNFNIIVETSAGKFSMRAKTSEITPGVVLLPYGLIDASVFYKNAFIRIIDEECV